MEIIINTLTKDRLPEYRDLRFEAITCEPNAFGVHLDEEKKLTDDEVLKLLFPDNGFDVILYAEVEGRIIGMVRICKIKTFFRKSHARIRSFFVKPKFQRNGIGLLLLTSAIEYVKKFKAIKKVDLGVVTTQQQAIAMYSRLGFVVTRHTKTIRYYNGVRLGSMIMTLYL